MHRARSTGTGGITVAIDDGFAEKADIVCSI